MWKTKIDKTFFWLTVALVVLGFFIFISASLGIHAREGVEFSRLIFNQVFFGIVLGGIALTLTSKISYKFWNKYAFYIFLISLIGTLLVFVPGLGFEHGGARRWISLGAFTFQPSEVLKLGFIIYWGAWLAGVKDRVKEFKYGPLPLAGFLAIVGVVLLMQPDTDTFAVIALSGLAMFIVAGGRWIHLGALALSSALIVGSIALARPYIRERIAVFLDPSIDPLGSGYQIQQSLIAIGSGKLFGRGMGQSVQKFNFLPEPIGDSIFAVFAEEWGFIGCIILLSLFMAFMLRGFHIAGKAKNRFGMLLVVGIVTVIISQSFINISSMLGLFPLSGIPLTFVSHGGTALLVALASVGIVLNVSKGKT